MASVKPVLQALVLADRVYEDKTSGKKIIAGTFSTLLFKDDQTSEQQPPEEEVAKVTIPASGMQAGSPHAYISITDVHDNVDLTLRYVHLRESEEKVMFQTECSIRCDDPLRTVELVIPLPPLPRIPGVFAFEVLWADELLGQHRIVVRELQA